MNSDEFEMILKECGPYPDDPVQNLVTDLAIVANRHFDSACKADWEVAVARVIDAFYGAVRHES